MADDYLLRNTFSVDRPVTYAILRVPWRGHVYLAVDIVDTGGSYDSDRVDIGGRDGRRCLRFGLGHIGRRNGCG